jgi:hypothetical protein
MRDEALAKPWCKRLFTARAPEVRAGNSIRVRTLARSEFERKKTGAEAPVSIPAGIASDYLASAASFFI